MPVTHTPVRTSPPSVVLIPHLLCDPSWNVAKTRADIITAPTPLSRAGHYPHRPPDSLRLLARPVVHQMPRVVLPAHTHIRLQIYQKAATECKMRRRVRTARPAQIAAGVACTPASRRTSPALAAAAAVAARSCRPHSTPRAAQSHKALVRRAPGDLKSEEMQRASYLGARMPGGLVARVRGGAAPLSQRLRHGRGRLIRHRQPHPAVCRREVSG